MIKTCSDFDTAVSLAVSAVVAHLILAAWGTVTPVPFLASTIELVHKRAVHGDEFAVVDLAILILVTFSGERVYHLRRSSRYKGM